MSADRHARPEHARAEAVTPQSLRDWPLPSPDEGGDKQERGQVLVVAGTGEIPGAALLCGIATLRAGAGKLQIATCASAAPQVAPAVPEARVVALPETPAGALAIAARPALDRLAAHADGVVAGPGLVHAPASARMLATWLMRLPAVPVVLDAAALAALDAGPHRPDRRRARLVLTPHALEAARLLGCDKDAVQADPLGSGMELARRHRAVVVMKGATSYVLDGEALASGASRTDGRAAVHCNRYGNVGLATSGSGDTLAGIVGGLVARGADPLQAAVWGVYLHAAAGDALAERFGTLGFLARELLAEVPRLMNGLSPVPREAG